jgi:polar amino acid transport system substrate-binding protein
MVLALLLPMIAASPAEALTVDSVTARSNQIGGNEVMGGRPVRVTWIGTVGPSESIESVVINLPDGVSPLLGDDASRRSEKLGGQPVSQDDQGSDQYSRVDVQVTSGSNRIEEDVTWVIDNERATVTFGKPVETGHKIQISVVNLVFPDADASYALTGSYTDDTGATRTFDSRAMQPIKVVARPPVEKLTDWLSDQPWVQQWNSFPVCQTFFKPQTAVSSVPALFVGWLRSLGLVLLGFPLAIPIGLAFSFLRMSKLAVLRFIASIYVNVIRGTPLFLQIYIIIFGLPMLGVNVDNYLLGIFVLAFNSSAYLAEIFRAGIQSIHKGQFEASASLGMNGAQTMFSVIIPQTVRRIIPTATSEFILLYKDTSLLAAVGVMELMMFSKSIVATSIDMTPYVVAAGYYLLVTLPLTKIIAAFEKKLAAAEGHTDEPPGKKKKRARRGSSGDSTAEDSHQENALQAAASAVGARGTGHAAGGEGS